MSNHVLEEANRCLQCKKPLCRTGCPINTNIPEMIRLLKENEIMQAAQMLFENNPLSIVCSLVCNHSNQCEGHCIRGKKGAPVHISAIENYISDSCFERLKLDMKPKNGKKVAVIGGGPAGITIAVLLAQKGYKVTIFEGHDKIGGVLRYGIPEFRLPKTILDRYSERLHELGIMIRPNFNIGGSTSIHDLLEDGYSSVFVGTGAWRPRTMKIPGETFGNVAYAINYLRNPDVYYLGNKVAVIGAGNAAMDVARTAIRKGAKEVTVYCAGNGPRASEEEVSYAKLDGVHFVTNTTCIEIKDESIVLCDVDNTGETRQILRDTAWDEPMDFTIIAISQVPKDKLVSRDKELQLNERGTLKTNEYGETTLDGVFASGDVVTGAKTVVAAVEQSKKIADDMDRYMQNK